MLSKTLYFRLGHCTHLGAPEHPRVVLKLGALNKPLKLKDVAATTELCYILPRG